MTNREEVSARLRSKFVCGLGITPGSIAYALGYTAPKGATYDDAIRELFELLADLIEPMYEPDPEWAAWVESLKNGDVVNRFAYDLIKYGGDMGPNGNKYEGIDEGLVLTGQLFDKFKADFKAEILESLGDNNE